MATYEERLAKLRDISQGNASKDKEENDYSSRLDALKKIAGASANTNTNANMAGLLPAPVNNKPAIKPPTGTEVRPEGHTSGKIDEGKTNAASARDTETRRRRYEREAAAFTPTSDMYLNKYTAAAADDMQRISSGAADEAARLRTLQYDVWKDLNDQRRKTNQAYRTANAFLPTEAMPAEAWDTYNKLYDEAVKEDEKLKAMGGAADRTILPAAIEQANAGYINAAGTLLDFASKYGYFSGEDDWMEKTPEIGAVSKLHDKADELAERSGNNLAGVKAGRGRAGNTLIDAAVSGTQMAGDALINTIAPGTGLAAMGVRAFGNAAQEARQRGAGVARQAGYGAAVAAVEVISEKLFDGLAGIYGGGAADDLVESVIEHMTESTNGRRLLRLLSSGGGEALEEAFSGLIDPALETIIDNEPILSHYNKDTRADIIQSMLVGFLLGGLGGTVELGTDIASNIGNQNGEITKAEQAHDKDMGTGAFFSNLGPESVRAVIDEGLDSAEGTESRTLAEELDQRIKDGGKVTNEEIGRLYQANISAINEESRQAGQSVQDYSADRPGKARADLAKNAEQQYNRITEEGVANGGTQIRNENQGRQERVGAGEQARSISQRAEQRYAEAVARRAAATDLRNQVAASPESREVSAKEFGIPDGSENTTLRTWPESLKTEGMKQCETDAASKGYKINWFSGDNTVEGGNIERAMVDPNTKQMWICADDSDASAEQLFRHEDFHTLPENVKAQVAAKLRTDRGAELDDLIGQYVDAYQWAGRDSAYVTEEILADAYAGIDVYAGRSDVYEGATRFTEDVRGAVAQNAAETEQTRGPPAEVKNSTSRTEEQGNGTGRNRQQATGRGGLDSDTEGNSAISEGERGGTDNRRTDKSESQRDYGPALRYDDLSDTQRKKAGEILLPVLSKSQTWNAALSGIPLSSVERMLYNGILDNSQMIQSIERQVPGFKQAKEAALAVGAENSPYVNTAKSAGNSKSVDDQGRTLSVEQERYFEKSVVRDENGNLLTVYHGTDAKFNVFEYGDIGYHFGSRAQAEYRNADRIIEAYINITSPIRIEKDLGSWNAKDGLASYLVDHGIISSEEADLALYDKNGQVRSEKESNDALRLLLQDKGYDGIIYKNKYEGAGNSYIVFDSSQAKQIDNKTPTESKDIRHSSKVVADNIKTPADIPSEPINPVVEIKCSTKFNTEYMDAARNVNDKTHNVDADVMDQAEKDRDTIKSYLEKVADLLPPDIEGNTFYSDSSYGGSEENTTVCVRSLAYEEFMDAIAEELGRPLTVEDTVFISQEAMALTDKPECLYCYVAMDRKAYREYLGKYIEQRDQFLQDIKDGMEVGLVEPVAKGKGVNRTIPKDTAYGKFLNGRANTKNMYNRAKLWMDSKNLITKKNLASIASMNKAALDPALRAQIDDAQAYAQAASWAKKKNGYAAYNNHILKWSKTKVNKLNKAYGLRLYSFSDFSPAFILENMQMLTDAAVKGLKALAYTKELDFVRIFAPTGTNINISVFGYNDGKGGVAMDAMQGADWEQAKALRDQYPNVGCTFVATNDAQVEWALAQDWIDVVIPFHIVRTGANVASMFGWSNYTDMSSDMKNPDWKKGDKTHIFPSEHQNDKAAYLELCEENHLTPRFEKWVDNENYMKLVNETRQSEADTQAVQPVFDISVAEQSIDEMVKRGGYMQHIGGTSENMQALAKEVAGKVEAKEVKHSSKITPQQDADYAKAVKDGNMVIAQRMVNEAAKEWGAITNERGKVIPLYHGTPNFGFTKFNTDAIFTTPDSGVAAGYGGGKGYADARAISEVYTPDNGSDKTLIKNVQNVLHQNARTITDADIEKVRSEFMESASNMNDRANAAWNYGEGFPEMPENIDNGTAWMLTLPGEIVENLDDILAGGEFTESLRDTVRNFNKYREEVREWFVDHRKEIIAAGNEDLYRLITGYDLTDFAIDVEYRLLRAADRQSNLIGETGQFANKERLREAVEQGKSLGAYVLYGNPGDNPLVIDAKGAFWANVKAPMLGESTMLTDEIVSKAQKAGYTSLIIKNVLDPAMNNYSPNRAADDYIFFNSESVRSADPVTYDDGGNVIPLSERFSEKKDFRYSTKMTNEEHLQRQNDDLRQRVEYWKGQTKRTAQPTARQADVDKVARDVVKYYGATIKAADIAGDIKNLTEIVMRGGEALTWGEVKDRAVSIARDVIYSAEELREGDGGYYDEVRSALKRPMVISSQDARDVSPDWKDWRNANRGKVNVSINGKGTPVDTIYAELSERFPGMFPEDITHPGDQLVRMAEVMDELEPVYENPYSRYMAEAVEECANDIIDRVLGEDIRQTPATFADKAAAKLAAEKARGAQKVAEVREQKNEKIAQIKAENAERAAAAIARERESRDKKIAALKEHYAEMKRNAMERKIDSANRTKLLNIARRLNNRKLPAVTRARLNEIIGSLDLVAKGITGYGLESLQTLQDWYNEQVENNPDFLRDEATEKRIARLHKKRIADMTVEEVAELTDVLLNLENEIRTEKNLIDSEDRRDIYQQGVDTIENVKATKGSKNGAIDKYILTETLSPLRAMHRYTGYAENDPLYQRTQELADGQRKMFDYQRRANEKFQRFMDDKKFIDKLAGKNAEWIEIRGYGADGKPVTVQITPAMRMSLYLHSLNDQNLKHIRDGGITIPDQKLYKEGKIAEAYTKGETVKLTPSAVRSIAAGMTAQERAFANAAHDYFNGQSRDEINAVSEKLKGYSLANVENYFPINTDTAFTKSDFEALKFDGTLEGMGFLKERVNAKNPIMLRDMNAVLTQSINQHSKYVGLAIPVRNFNKVWGVTTSSFNVDAEGNMVRNSFESSVQKAFGQQWGKDAVDYIEKMMTDLQNSGGKTNSWAKGLAKLRSNYAQAVLTLNLSVAMKQAASYPTAAAVIGWKPLARAMADVGKVDLDLIAKYTPLQWYRSQGFSTQELGDMAKRDGVVDKLMKAKVKVGDRDFMVLNWVQGVDVLTTRKLWKASEYYVRENNKNLKVGSDEYYKAVADIYNQVIEETQPNYTTMQRPQLLRSEDTLMQNLAMFKTQPFQNFNILYDAFGNLEAKRMAYNNASEENKAQAKTDLQKAQKRAAWAVESQVVSLAVFAAMTFAWAHLRGKDDKYKDEEGNLTFGSMLGGLSKNMLSGAMGMVPFGTEVYDLLASKLFGDKYYGVEAVTPSMISDFLSQGMKGFDVVFNAAKSAWNGEKVDWNDLRLKMESVVDTTSKVFGLPEENIKNLFNMVYRQTATRAAGEYAGEYAYLRLTASPDSKSAQYYDNLYKAYQNSPEEYAEILQDMIDSGDFDEDKIKSAMETRMKKSQGVASVEDLEQRWMSPEQQETYDKVKAGLENTKVYGNANEDQLAALQDAMYDYAVGNKSGAATADKIAGGEMYGLDENEYFQYLLALKVVDQPTDSGKTGTYNNEEQEKAIRMIEGLNDAERSYLWGLTHDSDKNNPFVTATPAKTTAKTSAKAETKAETEPAPTPSKPAGKPKSDTADVTGSSAIKAATYDPVTKTAHITYNSGRTYDYDNISASDWDAFKNADSKGSYVNRNWKGK